MSSRPRTPSTRPKGTISPFRRRWTRTEDVQAMHIEVPDGEYEKGGEGALEGWGPTHILYFQSNINRGRWFKIILSLMTVQELEAMQEVINAALAEAHSVCELRDRKAKEAKEDGDDVHFRLYRATPRVFDRSGSLESNRPSEGG